MADQFWFTSSPVGLKHINGYQVCAVSDGIVNTAIQIQRDLSSLINYRLPKGATTTNTSLEKAPLALTFVKHPKQGQGFVLMRRRFTGWDHDRRPDIFFAHVLVHLPDNLLAKQAISRWDDSSLWKIKAIEFRLGPISDENLCIDQSHPDFVIAQINKNSCEGKPGEFESQLAFLIQAYLQRGSRHIVICAESDRVAALIWALTHCLPDEATRELTFSTYEYDGNIDTLDLNVQIVGTDRASHGPPALRKVELPASCFAGSSIGLNCHTGKRTWPTLPTPDPDLESLAEFLASELIKQLRRDSSELKTYLAWATEQGAKDRDALGKIYRANLNQRHAPSKWNNEDFDMVLKSPSRAEFWLAKPEFQNELLSLDKAKTDWWLTTGRYSIRKLHQSGSAHVKGELEAISAKATLQAVDQLERAQNDSDIANISRLTNAAADFRGSKSDEPVWRDIVNEKLDRISKSKVELLDIGPKVRKLLLEEATKMEPATPISGRIRPLLQVPWDYIEKLLTPIIHDEWKRYALQYALHKALHENVPLRGLDQIVRLHPTGFQEAIGKLIKEAETPSRIQNLIHYLFNSGYGSEMDLWHQAVATKQHDLGVFDLALNALRTRHNGTLRDMLSQQPSWHPLLIGHIDSVPDQSVLLILVADFFSQIHLADCSPDTVKLLKELTQTRRFRQLASVWLDAVAFAQADSFNGTKLSSLCRELGNTTDLDVDLKQRLIMYELKEAFIRQMTDWTIVAQVVKIVTPVLPTKHPELQINSNELKPEYQFLLNIFESLTQSFSKDTKDKNAFLDRVTFLCDYIYSVHKQLPEGFLELVRRYLDKLKETDSKLLKSIRSKSMQGKECLDWYDPPRQQTIPALPPASGQRQDSNLYQNQSLNKSHPQPQQSPQTIASKTPLIPSNHSDDLNNEQPELGQILFAIGIALVCALAVGLILYLVLDQYNGNANSSMQWVPQPVASATVHPTVAVAPALPVIIGKTEIISGGTPVITVQTVIATTSIVQTPPASLLPIASVTKQPDVANVPTVISTEKIYILSKDVTIYQEPVNDVELAKMLYSAKTTITATLYETLSVGHKRWGRIALIGWSSEYGKDNSKLIEDNVVTATVKIIKGVKLRSEPGLQNAEIGIVSPNNNFEKVSDIVIVNAKQKWFQYRINGWILLE